MKRCGRRRLASSASAPVFVVLPGSPLNPASYLSGRNKQKNVTQRCATTAAANGGARLAGSCRARFMPLLFHSSSSQKARSCRSWCLCRSSTQSARRPSQVQREPSRGSQQLCAAVRQSRRFGKLQLYTHEAGSSRCTKCGSSSGFFICV